jgi:hypothetical protein
LKAIMLVWGCLAAMPAVAAAEGDVPACAGEACSALEASGGGCDWRNAGDRPIRFTVFDAQQTIVSTVLAPTASFRQPEASKCVSGERRVHAVFAAVRPMPDAPDFTLKTAAAVSPRTKPADLGAPVTMTSQAPAPEAQPVLPAPKPATPLPRPKPARLVAPAEPPAPAVTAAVQPLIPVPTAAEIEAGASPCGEACGEVMLKTIGSCLWVQSQNPRPIVVQATVNDRMVVLMLEGASYDKSAAAPPAGATAYHTRQKDPFQSSSAGIPVYLARLDDQGACVADRAQVSQVLAAFRK